MESPANLLLLDIDGLRADVFQLALDGGRLPHIFRLLAKGIHLPVASTAPSITFTAQTTLFTGLDPSGHGIAGNQFFDRFGTHNRGVPRFYAFDIGDTLAVDDAVGVFQGETGLLSQLLPHDSTTLYEQLASYHQDESLAGYHILARGVGKWLRPDLLDIARFTKGGGLLGLSAESYDARMVAELLNSLRGGSRPRVVTAYFMGLDHHSHQHGPDVQEDYLSRVIDPLIGRLAAGLENAGMLENTLVAVFSDHGQIGVIADDRHSLRLSFPFDREMGYLFDALHLDVHDFPGEDPDCDAVVASNGGLAQVYLQNRAGRWKDPPRIKEDILPVAAAFWQANQSGEFAPDLLGALALVLVKDVEHAGWEAEYQAYTPEGLLPLKDALALQPGLHTVDAVPRLRALAGVNSGDLLLVSNIQDGFYFGSPAQGMHGGLHPQESRAVLSLGWVGGTVKQSAFLRESAAGISGDRRQVESREFASLADLSPILRVVMGGKEMS